MALSPDEIQFIRDARIFLENPSFLIRASNILGKPLEKTVGYLPEKARSLIRTAAQRSLERGLKMVTGTLSYDSKDFASASRATLKSGRWHSVAAFSAGVAGGLFGMASLPIELPVTTGIMLRSIASIARDFGFDVSQADVQLECLYVLSLGSSDFSYWSSRVAFTDLIRHAAREMTSSTAPYLVRFLAQVAARFELVVSEKALAELVPIVGAVGGGAINAAFSEHFNQAARFHFGLRALEKKVSSEDIQAIYHS